MIHSEGLPLKCVASRVWGWLAVAVERHKIWVRIPRGVKLDRRLTRAHWLRHRW